MGYDLGEKEIGTVTVAGQISGLLNGIGTYWEVQDYRAVDGVLLPHKIVCSRKGGSSTFVFEEIKHNVPIDDGKFSMPNVGKP